MLGSLARKLRVFGFDSLYFREGPDSEIERIARTEGRAVLTSDRRLREHLSAQGLTAFLVVGRSDSARIRTVIARARAASLPLRPGPTRCAFCNVELKFERRSEVAGRVPEAVFRRHRQFYSCPRCGRLFWKGDQWTRLRRLESLLRVSVRPDLTARSRLLQ